MLSTLIIRQLRSRFIGSSAGWLWLVVNPILLLGVYSVVFGVIFDARAPSGLDMPFVAWLAIALWPWLGFSEGIMRASESMPQHAGLISKVPMRRELLAISSATAAFVLQLAGYVVVLVVMALLGIALTPAGFVNGALVLAVLMLLSNALGLFAATLRVFFADIQQLLPTLLMLWFFLTPILYSPEYLPEELQILVFANPLAGLMTDLRAALLEGQALPGVTTLVMLAVSVAAYLLGLAFFRRMAPYFEDFL
ncbi:MAG: ABC transporter permease [Wenzhouxiangellaceae bacterium]|nr:ABC transporter permease [Wenzhouxiangellaceae bacterium]